MSALLRILRDEPAELRPHGVVVLDHGDFRHLLCLLSCISLPIAYIFIYGKKNSKKKQHLCRKRCCRYDKFYTSMTSVPATSTARPVRAFSAQALMEHDVGEQHRDQNAQLIDGRDEAGRAELQRFVIAQPAGTRRQTRQADEAKLIWGTAFTWPCLPCTNTMTHAMMSTTPVRSAVPSWTRPRS